MTPPLHAGARPARKRSLAPFSAPTGSSEPFMGQLLRHIGADPHFAEAVLGDLAEEFAYRTERDGGASARWWYALEGVRSAPHFVRSWFRYAQLHARGQIVAVFGGIAATSLVLVLAILARNGPPARLEFGASNQIVINNEQPVHVPVQVLDARGHTLQQSEIHFRYVSGAPIHMSPNGIVTCNYMADALVRVSLGDLSRDLMIRCRPISTMELMNGGDYIEGDPPSRLNLVAAAPDGRSVGLVAGSMTVSDTTVATLDGLMLTPRRPGTARVVVRAGDRKADMPVRVWKRMPSPAALKPLEAYSAKLDMRTGETRRWSIGRGLHMFSLTDSSPDGSIDADPFAQPDASPRLTLASLNANCIHIGPNQVYMCAALNDAEVIVYAPRRAPSDRRFSSRLVIRRMED